MRTLNYTLFAISLLSLIGCGSTGEVAEYCANKPEVCTDGYISTEKVAARVTAEKEASVREYQKWVDEKKAEELENRKWRTSCNYDQFTDKTSCKASARGPGVYGGDGGPMVYVAWISSMSKQTRYLCISGQDFPGENTTFRVDSGAVITGTDDGCTTVPQSFYDSMKAGKELFVVYNEFPYTGQRTIIQLQGFAAAYDDLSEKVNAIE